MMARLKRLGKGEGRNGDGETELGAETGMKKMEREIPIDTKKKTTTTRNRGRRFRRER
jgi:hypothetical protein